MTEEETLDEKTVEALKCLRDAIKAHFPLDSADERYLSELETGVLKNDDRICTEYLDLTGDMAAMYFDDARHFVPIVMLVETTLALESKSGLWVGSLAYLIQDWSESDLRKFTIEQLMDIKTWLSLLANVRWPGIKDDSDAYEAISKLARVIDEKRYASVQHYG